MKHLTAKDLGACRVLGLTNLPFLSLLVPCVRVRTTSDFDFAYPVHRALSSPVCFSSLSETNIEGVETFLAVDCLSMRDIVLPEGAMIPTNKVHKHRLAGRPTGSKLIG